MKKMNFKKAIEALGYNVVKFTRGYNFRSAFATDGNGKLWYFNIEDLRDQDPVVFRRTAESLTDYRGGVNLFDVEQSLEDLGIKIKQPRERCDFNSEGEYKYYKGVF